MGKVKAVCISEKKGTAKNFVSEAEFKENFGIIGDAHAGDWHRQVSLLSYETITDFNAKGANVTDGAFGENLIIEGLNLTKLRIGSKLKFNEVELELTQIGKECHTRCAIYHRMSDCIMPKNGVFARVVKGGKMKAGENVHT